ncbi:MAG: hypothetical protein ACK5MT_14190 [Actinomycetales bacterium]
MFGDLGARLLAEAITRLVELANAGLVLACSTWLLAWFPQQPVSWTPESLFLDTVTGTQADLRPFMLVLVVASLLVGGARMAWERRAQPGLDLIRSLLIASCVAGGSVAIVAAAMVSSQGLAMAILDEAVVRQGVTTLQEVGSTPGSAPLLTSLLILIAMIATVTQIIVLVLRSAVLAIMMVVLPCSAAFTNLELGRVWFTRCCSWTLAFVLYKPVAAVVYMISFRMLAQWGGSEEGGIYTLLIGITLMALSVLALPALMRACTPLVGAVAGGTGSGQPLPPLPSVPQGALKTPSGAGSAPGGGAGGGGGGGSAPSAKGAASTGSGGGSSSTGAPGNSPKGSATPGGTSAKGGSPGPQPGGSPGMKPGSPGMGGVPSGVGGSSAAGAGSAATGAASAIPVAGAVMAVAVTGVKTAAAVYRGAKQVAGAAAADSTGEGPRGSQ